MIPELSHDRIDRLREALLAANYTADGVVDSLGPHAHAALGRGEPEPAIRATAEVGALGTLIRLFLVGDPVAPEAAERALRPLPLEEALAGGILVRDGESVRAGLDIRPHAATGNSWWIISDLDAEVRPPHLPVSREHVLGVGQASLSLVRATPTRRVGSLLDLGTGCGVQALHASTHADHVTVTDLSERALALAEATFRLNRIEVERLRGDWFSPVEGRRFDQVVCNPPFVVGPARTDFVYRDSGMSGDDASALVVGRVPELLDEEGTGHVLASWLHREDEDWRERVSGWLRHDDVDAWFVQRDVADPELYVGTWLRDAGMDPKSDAGRRKAEEWLEWFEANDVTAVGFGFVTLRRTSGGQPGRVVCEDLRQAFDDPLGAEAEEWLRRIEWLRQRPTSEELLGSPLVTAPGLVLEQVSSPESDGWSTFVHRLHRTDGPGWQHEVDETGAKLIAGCQGALATDELLELLAAGYGADPVELARSAEPVLRELIQHGMLLPAEWREQR
ncbi:PqqD family peptide modification chaperone [Actinopolyspora xinjiangensis]|uniref:PqqD family peptide modification chaperone n=1 Tax=Actinopolyspora xinjiangensis TaxID=405564 RepID=UPI000B80B8F2|nr:PqqD family peptide modification chaperone [Actinopolyspora xinjiangensis]